MHIESFWKMELFVKEYLGNYSNEKLKIAELGSKDDNGSYKFLFKNKNWEYYGLDIKKGKNVDIVLKNPYKWEEIPDNYYDVLISGQTFEHIEFPWLTIKEIYRVLKPNGLCCIIVPSKGPEHKAPVDCWRIYPDGIKALAKWGKLRVIEVFTEFGIGQWGDTFAVLQKIETNHNNNSVIRIENSKNIYSKFNPFQQNQEDLFELIKNVERHFSLSEKNLVCYFNLGLLYIYLNQINQALSLFKKALHFQMANKITNRTTIIQRLINIFGYKTYLEIGVDKGFNFFQIQAPYKIGVDPYFKFDINKFRYKSNFYFFPQKSDEFFENVPDIVKERGLDIVFIDGNHTYEQSYKDVINSLKYLNQNGIILMHDCYPRNKIEGAPTLYEAKKYKNFNGSWRGEVYKTIINLRSTRDDLSIFVIDCDCGVGIIKKEENFNKLNFSENDISRMKFEDFIKNAKNFLNLRSTEWFQRYPNSALTEMNIIKIRKYKKLAIFGLGKSGKMTYEFIKKYYPEKIKYFIDDNVKGEYNGIPIVTTEEFLEKHQDEVDLVVFGKYQHLNPKLIPNLKIDYLRLENIV